MERIDTWHGDRCLERRNQRGRSGDFARPLRLLVPESDLRVFTDGWEAATMSIPASDCEQIRVIDLLFSQGLCRCDSDDWPLRSRLWSELATSGQLPDGRRGCLIHFQLSMTSEIEQGHLLVSRTGSTFTPMRWPPQADRDGAVRQNAVAWQQSCTMVRVHRRRTPINASAPYPGWRAPGSRAVLGEGPASSATK
jgi:hypothetical protein